jgi:endonuclease-8
MPEGDTIRGAAGRIRGALVGKEIASIETPHPRFARDRWAERLSGRAVHAVDAKGKHLFIRFDGDLTLHSHLRMNGWWGVYERGRRWSKSPSRAWLVIRTADHEVVQFGGPVLELMTDSRSRFDQRIARLGPDVLADGFDEAAFLKRLREDDASRGIGDALLDQRNICGIGNLWKSEACFIARLDPWRPLGRVSDGEALAAVNAVRPLMLRSAQGGGVGRDPWVFERHGRPCRRCGTTIRARGQGDDNRTTYWCPACQA